MVDLRPTEEGLLAVGCAHGKGTRLKTERHAYLILRDSRGSNPKHKSKRSTYGRPKTDSFPSDVPTARAFAFGPNATPVAPVSNLEREAQVLVS